MNKYLFLFALACGTVGIIVGLIGVVTNVLGQTEEPPSKFDILKSAVTCKEVLKSLFTSENPTWNVIISGMLESCDREINSYIERCNSGLPMASPYACDKDILDHMYEYQRIRVGLEEVN